MIDHHLQSYLPGPELPAPGPPPPGIPGPELPAPIPPDGPGAAMPGTRNGLGLRLSVDGLDGLPVDGLGPGLTPAVTIPPTPLDSVDNH